MSVTSLRIPADIEAPLEYLSQRLDRSKNYLINQAIKEFLAKQMVADSRWEDTLAALTSVEDAKLVAAGKVADWLQTWGADNEQVPPVL